MSRLYNIGIAGFAAGPEETEAVSQAFNAGWRSGTRILSAAALALLSFSAQASEMKEMIYPQTVQVDVVDDYFGERIADPYRWLENDIRQDEKVASWVEAQNALSRSYLEGLPGRELFRERLAALYDYDTLGLPRNGGGRYFFTRKSGLEDQAVLYMRLGTDGSEQVVIDPNEWSGDDTTALAEWAPSSDGALVAYAVQEGGADWRTIHVLEVASGAVLDDQVKWARFTAIAWAIDGSGFFYSRNPEPEDAGQFVAQAMDHSVYFHRLGTPQSEDRLVHGPKTSVPLLHTVDVTPDGRWAVITSSALSGGNNFAVIDLTAPEWPVRTLVNEFDDTWHVSGNIGSTFFLTTQDDAERGRVVTVDVADPEPIFTELIPERDDRILWVATLVGDRLLVTYLTDARTEVERFRLDGTYEADVDIPGLGTVGGFIGRDGDNEAFFAVLGYDIPTSIYRYNVAGNAITPWAEPQVAIDLDSIEVKQSFYPSQGDTQVPIFIVRRADRMGPAPTMLHGYGGFGIPMVPMYSPAAMAWVEQGGIYAVANIRGGGEYGKSWHDAGRGQHKQNVFDDFIAAGEYLLREGITPAGGLAIHGSSNGGLLISAVVNQRPDLFTAAIAGVGVHDMLRFNRFTGGQLWTQEFGSPAKEADFRNLVSYSPLHNVGAEVDYPAVLVTTADTDDRVVPAHSFKYVATLQAASIGARPHLLRVETQAGHGTGKPTDLVIEEFADMWAFAAHWTGLELAGENVP